jgi:hypothetical protein
MAARANSIASRHPQRRSDMTLKFRGYDKLQKCVSRTGFDGEWSNLEDQQKQYRTTDGGILNWWRSTGTISFQGRQSAARQLEKAFIAVASAKGRIETKDSRSLADRRDENERLKILANTLLENAKLRARISSYRR